MIDHGATRRRGYSHLFALGIMPPKLMEFISQICRMEDVECSVSAARSWGIYLEANRRQRGEGEGIIIRVYLGAINYDYRCRHRACAKTYAPITLRTMA